MYCIKTDVQQNGWRSIACTPLSIAEALELTLQFILDQRDLVLRIAEIRGNTFIYVRTTSKGGIPVPEFRFRVSAKEYPFLQLISNLIGGLRNALREEGAHIQADNISWAMVESTLLTGMEMDVCNAEDVERLRLSMETLFKFNSTPPTARSGEHLIDLRQFAIAG
jgi:hypothetical protein